MKIRSSYEYHLPVARHPGWVRFRSTSCSLPTLILVALATCLPFFARSEFVSEPLVDRPIPPIDRSAPFTSKVRSLLAVLTLDEKISLVHGATDPDLALVGQVGYLPGVPRLGIPVRRDSDALGIEVVAYATALPARLGLGATFDRRAVQAAGELVGNEGRALGVDLVYAPQVDLTRQPNWLRNNTTYGEDPFLNGQLAIQEVTGIQSKGLMSQVKHYTLYNGQAGVVLGAAGEPALPTVVDDQTAHELYLKEFEYPLTQGHASSVMASYQGFQIIPLQQSPAWAADNALTLTAILRGQWHFRGFVLSDYGAVHSVHSLLSGLDQEYPGNNFFGLFSPPTPYFATQLKALIDPTSPSYNPLYALALDDAVAYVLYAYERFGLLECASPAGPVAGCSPAPRPNINDLKDADATTVERLSEESAVLLKNEGNVLPLKGSDLQSVAVIGPTGRQVMVNGGQPERARGFRDRDAINPLQVLRALAPAGSFTYAPGIDWIGSVVPATALSPGLTRTESDSNATQVDPTIDYGASASSDLKLGVTYTWTGKLTVPVADTYYLWIQQGWRDWRFAFFSQSVSLSIDGASPSLFMPGVPDSTYPPGVIPANGANHGVAVSLSAGPHTIKITAAVPLTGRVPINAPVPVPVSQPVTFRLAWSRLGDTIASAVAAARSAKVALVFADDNGAANAELVNSLAANQDALIAAVAKANPNTVVVLSTGDPVLMPWLKDVKAVLEMWYPGQEGGTSTAKLLLGQANPGGRLPITWPASGDQTPFAGHPERVNGDGTKVPFSEGLYVGYRWYDQQKITPLFPFGHGLSYTQFDYSNLEIRPDSGGLEVSFEVQNTGPVKGSEVPQVYVGAPSNPPPLVQFAPQKLVGFKRVELDAGDGERVSVRVSQRELSYWSTAAQRWVLAGGDHNVYVGASSRDIRLHGRTRVEGEHDHDREHDR